MASRRLGVIEILEGRLKRTAPDMQKSAHLELRIETAAGTIHLQRAPPVRHQQSGDAEGEGEAEPEIPPDYVASTGLAREHRRRGTIPWLLRDKQPNPG